jgi:hypothetical protein
MSGNHRFFRTAGKVYLYFVEPVPMTDLSCSSEKTMATTHPKLSEIKIKLNIRLPPAGLVLAITLFFYKGFI